MESPLWLSGLRPLDALTFAGVRAASGDTTFALVLECAAERDRLIVRPRGADESPLDVLADPARRSELRTWPARHAAGETLPGVLDLSLGEMLAHDRFAAPLPPPEHIFGVAANFPSHLVHDLGLASFEPERERLAASRARVFLKHPDVAPPGYSDADDLGFPGLRGPYDGIQHPQMIAVPLGPDRTSV